MRVDINVKKTKNRKKKGTDISFMMMLFLDARYRHRDQKAMENTKEI
tara:strand:- start:111 stop:251 length:141 start_codon:yes stop_codon:yes gene_type:complete